MLNNGSLRQPSSQNGRLKSSSLGVLDEDLSPLFEITPLSQPDRPISPGMSKQNKDVEDEILMTNVRPLHDGRKVSFSGKPNENSTQPSEFAEIEPTAKDLRDVDYGDELLYKYARGNKHEDLERILDRPHSRYKRNINKLDSEKLSALHYAARYNSLECLKLLVERGANVNIINDEKSTPLHLAARYRRKRHLRQAGDTDEISEDKTNELMKMYGRLARNTKRIIEEENLPTQENSVILFLVSHGAKVNQQDFYGCTPLHYAAMRGNEIAADHLLRVTGIDLEIKDNEQMTPLHLACSSAHAEVVRMLLSHNAFIYCVEETGCLPIHLASMEGSVEIVTQMLDVANKRDGPQAVRRLLNQPDRDSNTCLHSAVSNGHFELAKLCINRGGDVNAVTNNEDTALHMASQFGSIELVKLLVNQGAIVDKYDMNQQTPLHRAAERNRCDVIKFLLSKGADPEARDSDSQTPIILAAQNGNEKVIEIFINMGANILAADKLNQSALHWAVFENQLPCVKLLLSTLEKDNLVDMFNNDNESPLHVACMKGYVDIVKVLLDAGGDIDAKNEADQTPMHLAAMHGRTQVVRYLCSKDPRLCNDEDEDSNMPLHLAAFHGHAKVIQALIDEGAEVEAANCDKWTALDCAAAKGKLKAAQVLLDNDAPVDSQDRSKVTPLYLACKHGHPDLVDLLLRNKADPTIRVAAEDDDPTSGFNSLDIAIDKGNKLCVKSLLKHSRWKEAMRNQTKLPNGLIDTPMRKLIRKMPGIAEMVFDKCTERTSKHPEHKDHTIIFDYEFLDDMYAHWTLEESEMCGDCGSTSGISSGGSDVWIYDQNEKVKDDVKPYSENTNILKINHPLMIMSTSHREDLLSHPLVVSLLQHKWIKFGRTIYYLNLFVYIVFLAFLTTYMMTTSAPFYYEKENSSISNSDPICTAVVSIFNVSQSLAANVSKYGVMILAVYALIKEIIEMAVAKLSYFTFDNLLEWSLNILAFITVLDLNECQLNSGVRERWQWQTGAVAIFLAWLNLILFLAKVPRFGIFVVMFISVLKTFVKFFIVFFLFIVAFAFGFYTLLSNQIPFQNFGLALMKTSVMVIGEFDYQTIFTDQFANPSDPTVAVNYDGLSFTMFALFVALMSIITMNLLVGLAVDDIKGVMESAALKRMAMQVDLALSVEKILPHMFRRKFVVRALEFKPNQKRNVFQRVFGSSIGGSQLVKYWREEDDTEEKLLSSQERMEVQVYTLKKRLKVLTEQNERFTKMMEAVMKKLDIKFVDDDVEEEAIEIMDH